MLADDVNQNRLADDEVRYAIEARQKYLRDRTTELNIAVEEAEARWEAGSDLNYVATRPASQRRGSCRPGGNCCRPTGNSTRFGTKLSPWWQL